MASITLFFAGNNLFPAYVIAHSGIEEPKTLQLANNNLHRGQDNLELTVGKPVEKELAGNQAHSYKIVLAANQYLHVIVEQRGIDVVVALFAPDGKKSPKLTARTEHRDRSRFCLWRKRREIIDWR